MGEAGFITTTTIITMDTVTMAMGVCIPPEECTIATGKLIKSLYRIAGNLWGTKYSWFSNNY